MPSLVVGDGACQSEESCMKCNHGEDGDSLYIADGLQTCFTSSPTSSPAPSASPTNSPTVTMSPTTSPSSSPTSIFEWTYDFDSTSIDTDFAYEANLFDTTLTGNEDQMDYFMSSTKLGRASGGLML